MASSNEELFRKAINSVFNSWTALQLAVEHGMGGPQGNAKALAMMDSVIDLYRSKDSVDWQDVADLLSDLMDNEFNTICEDDSTDEVGCVIWEMQRLCALGDVDGVEAEISKLPSCKQWLKNCVPQPADNATVIAADSDDSDDGDEQMETEGVDPDPGWTQVLPKLLIFDPEDNNFGHVLDQIRRLFREFVHRGLAQSNNKNVPSAKRPEKMSFHETFTA